MCCRSHLIAIVLGRGAWGNGAPIRDYVNSDEVVSANILMLEDLPSSASFTLNGSGGTSTKESHIGKRSQLAAARSSTRRRLAIGYHGGLSGAS